MRVVITFSVNDKRFNEEDLSKIDNLLKELEKLNESKEPNYADYKRVAISKLVSDLLNGEMKEDISRVLVIMERAQIMKRF
ncbi:MULTISPECIES: hypothetical protein [Paenibacillus]|uniref:Uncharacterized protein n=1 Tax=Paenibacillus odorifer TaxID=189426 RepID=A0ABX3HGY5_9BACL|nr:hypothetical protein [Paenibacillus odorifer]OMD48515.1 hypothetical protein BSK51_21530 [Paenibacillus odorifer]